MDDLSLRGNLYQALQAQSTGKNLKSDIGTDATFLKATTLALAGARFYCIQLITVTQIAPAVLKQRWFNLAQTSPVDCLIAK